MDMSMRQATRLNAFEVGQGTIHWNDMGTRCLAVLCEWVVPKSSARALNFDRIMNAVKTLQGLAANKKHLSFIGRQP